MGNPGSNDDAQSVDVRRPVDVNMPPAHTVFHDMGIILDHIDKSTA